jgi:SET domain-containing protein
MVKVNRWCRVRRSKIHGNGVFAIRDIPKGTDIIEYTGKIVSKKEGTRRAREQDEHLGAVYVFGLNNTKDVDGFDCGKGAQYINHSCDPNCESINYDDEEIWIQAMRKIKKGEELTYDYGFNDDGNCMCGSKHCRGKMSTTNKD